MMDMTQGPLAGKLLIFTLPVMLAGVLQLLFNAADIIVVGRLAGSNSLAAVGSNGALINLIVNLLIGLSVGSGVATAYFYGAREMEQVKETIHTSIAISLLGGLVTAAAGVCLSPILLRLMATPDGIIGLSQLYLRIYFLGMPSMAVYNFGSAILRSLGDTKRPLYYLVIAGLINIILNITLVAVFHLDVAGVAIATVVSQTVSAVLVVRCLMHLEPEMNLEWKKVRVSRSKLIRILRVGLPAGVQSTVFSLSNVLIQSSVNSFGEVAVAGNSAAGNIEGFIYIAMNSFYQAAQTFTSQNVGAHKFDRIGKVFLNCFLMVTATGVVFGLLAYRMGNLLLGIYLPGDEAAIAYGLTRLSVIAVTYCLCGIMEVISGELRGMGESVLPMVVSLLGSCLLRIIWIYTVFAAHHTLTVLYLSYPVSWLVTEAAHLICYFYVKRRLIRAWGQTPSPAAGEA
ncbi:MAG: MATE family efflux transporter [Clostridiales bacterium]|nr:MATE family efflux transporter [Clostridiales bacterium]